MKSETLKINVAQRVLSLSDEKLLIKISRILDEENIVGFDAEGNPVKNQEFIADVNDTLQQIEDNTLETYSTDDVKHMIFGE